MATANPGIANGLFLHSPRTIYHGGGPATTQNFCLLLYSISTTYTSTSPRIFCQESITAHHNMSGLPKRLIKITDTGKQSGIEINLVTSDFLDEETPYVIVSHRCTPFDVTYSTWDQNCSAIRDLINDKRQDNTYEIEYDRHPGHSKVAMACVLALQDGINYIWLDGPCINKTGEDPNEFQREIASMYRYYKHARHCYAFLSDVGFPAEARDAVGIDLAQADLARWRCRISSFANSEWFTRGWTLQELLAPGTINFYDHHWNMIGTKQQKIGSIVAATGIQQQYLNGQAQDNIGSACTAVKMSWAANRSTTHEEDMAYCLLGLFGLTMPVVPGEGENGFMRLQQLIVNQRPSDESIFAWYVDPEELGLSSYGLLAPWVSCFRKSGSVTIDPVDESLVMERDDPPYQSRGAGIDFNIPMDYPNVNQGTSHNTARLAKMEAYNLGLNCWLRDHEGGDKVLTIRLHRKGRGSPWRRQNVNCLSDGNNLKKSKGGLMSGYASYTQPCHIPNRVPTGASSAASEVDAASRLASMVKKQNKRKIFDGEEGPPRIVPLEKVTNHITQPKGLHAMAWQGKQYATATKPWSL